MQRQEQKRWLTVVEKKHNRGAELWEDTTEIQLNTGLPGSQGDKKFAQVVVKPWFHYFDIHLGTASK